MFESLLEKILQSKLGKYLDGLDEKNLNVGIWSGNVEIENVSLKPTIFDFFHLPIKLLYSSIARISLKIPWKNLSSSPVEIVIEKVLAIVSPKEEKDWTFTDYNKINQRFQLLADYSNEIFEKLLAREKALENKGSDKKEAGYMDKIVLKVLDNLQITIKSIHIRVENLIGNNKYSLGMTLNFLSIHATNEKWEKKFIDRTDSKNENLPSYKILLLNNFSVYWNSDEKNFFSLLPKNTDFKPGMESLIRTDETPLKNIDYLINIKAELKSIQNNGKEKLGPEFWFSLKMGNIDLNFKKKQILDALKLTSYLNRFKKAFDENKKKASSIEIDKESQKSLFLKYYKQWELSEKNKEMFPPKEWSSFCDIVSNNSLEDLCEWVKIIMKEIHKDKNLKKQEIEKKKAAKSFWSWGSDDSKNFTKEDIKQLELLYDKNFSDEAISMPVVTIKDKKFIEFEFVINLNGGSLSLILTKEKEEIEKVVFLEYKGFLGNFKKRECNKEIKIILKELSVIAQQKNNGKLIFTQNLFQKSNLDQQHNNFFECFYQENPLVDQSTQKVDEISPDYSIDLKVGSTMIIYDPIPVKWIRKFFNIEFEDQEIVDKTIMKMNKINDDYQVNSYFCY